MFVRYTILYEIHKKKKKYCSYILISIIPSTEPSLSIVTVQGLLQGRPHTCPKSYTPYYNN